jgi:zinc protease
MSSRIFAGAFCLLALPTLAHAQVSPAPLAVASTSTEVAAPARAPSVAVAPEPGTPPAPPSPEAAPLRLQLENGLSVVLQPDHSRQRVALAVHYGVGAADDPPGYRGLAHLTEHCMFEGSASPEHADFFSWLGHAGATASNGVTSRDHTLYYEELPSSQLELGLWLEAMRMGHLLSWLDDAMVARARAAVLHEHEPSTSSCGGECLRTYQARALYPEGHPYRQPMEDSDDIESIQLAHVQWFVQRWYGPDNATLAVVGDFDPLVVRAQVTALFGALQRSRLPAQRPAVPAVALEGEHRLSVRWRRDDATCSHVWPVPATVAHADDRALDVLARHLEHELSDRALDHASLQSADAFYFENDLSGELHLSWFMVEGADPDEVGEEIEKLLGQARSELLSAAQLARAREPLRRAALLGRESLVGRSAQLASTARDAKEQLSRTQLAAEYSQVTAAQVRDVARRFMPADRRVSMCVTHSDGAPRLGKLKRHRFTPASNKP